MRIPDVFQNLGRFIMAGLPDLSPDSTCKDIPADYRKSIIYNADGRPRCVPLAVACDNKSQVRLIGVDAFNRYFVNVASLIASPGQGKSRLATSIYNLMRDTKEDYFKVSDNATSFTKGIWRLSDQDKKELIGKDVIDILDVEGLQKDNMVYYLLIVVVILSQSIVLLSRERVNKEALGVLDMAFKILHQLGIALHKPVLFIQTKTKKDGTLLDGERKPITKEELLEGIKRDIPIVGDFDVEFFGLTEVPEYETLKDAETTLGMPEGTADNMFKVAAKNYEADVIKLIKRLEEVKDQVPSEIRMHYLMTVLNHLNDNNPDLVLEQNLAFFEKDIKRWLDVAVCQEKEKIISFHRNKPLGKSKTLKDFFEQPIEDLHTKYIEYCENDSPFLGKMKDKHEYQKKSQEVFENHPYSTIALKATDPSTGNLIGIMSYVQPDFEAKKQTEEAVLTGVFLLLKKEAECSYCMFTSKIPSDPPAKAILKVKSKYANIDEIDDIIGDRWKQVVVELESRKESLIAESKWLKKVRLEGSLSECSACGNVPPDDTVTHKNCSNKNAVPTILWYWLKGSTKYGICNGCETIEHLKSYACGNCDKPLDDRHIAPDW